MNGKVIKFIQETFDLIKIIKTTRKENLFLDNYIENVKELNKVNRKLTFLSEIIVNSRDLFFIIILILPISYFIFIKDIEFIEAIPILSIFFMLQQKFFHQLLKFQVFFKI